MNRPKGGTQPAFRLRLSATSTLPSGRGGPSRSAGASPGGGGPDEASLSCASLLPLREKVSARSDDG